MSRASVCAECVSNDFTQLGESKVWYYGTIKRLSSSYTWGECRLCSILAVAISSALAKIYNIEGEPTPGISQAWSEFWGDRDDWQVLAIIVDRATYGYEEQSKSRLWVMLTRPDYVELVADTLENVQRSRKFLWAISSELGKS